MTGRSTYTPEFLLGLNRWGSDRLAALAHAARGIPEGWFGVVLVVLLTALVALAWPRGRSVRSARQDHESDKAVPPSSEVLPARQEPDAP